MFHITFLPTAATPRLNAYFGPGTGSVYLSYVRCKDDDSSLILCASTTLNSSTCSHYQDVGVECEGNYQKSWYLYKEMGLVGMIYPHNLYSRRR